MPACIGMTARTSAPAVQCGDRPAPSVPSRMATLVPRPARILRRAVACGHRGEVDGVLGQGQRHRGEAGGPQQIGARGPVGQPRPGQAEHGAHAHLDRLGGRAGRPPAASAAPRPSPGPRRCAARRRRWCGRPRPRSPPAARPSAGRRPCAGPRDAARPGRRGARGSRSPPRPWPRSRRRRAPPATAGGGRPVRAASARPAGRTADGSPLRRARRITFSPSAMNRP